MRKLIFACFALALVGCGKDQPVAKADEKKTDEKIKTDEKPLVIADTLPDPQDRVKHPGYIKIKHEKLQCTSAKDCDAYEANYSATYFEVDGAFIKLARDWKVTFHQDDHTDWFLKIGENNGKFLLKFRPDAAAINGEIILNNLNYHKVRVESGSAKAEFDTTENVCLHYCNGACEIKDLLKCK